MGKKITVRSAKGAIKLEKSDKYVALKTKTHSFSEKEKSIEKKARQNLGGFEVVELKKKGDGLDKELDKLRKKNTVNVGSHIYHVEGSDKPIVPTGEIFIVFHEGTNEEEQLIVLDEYHLELVERRNENRVIAKVTPLSSNPLKVAAAMESYPLVKLAEPDLDIPLDEYAFFEPEDHLYEHQWHLQNPGFVVDFNRRLKKGADSKVVDAWKRLDSFGSENIKLGIIDNGFDLSHPDFEGKIVDPYDLWNRSSHVLQGDPVFTHGTPCASVAIAGLNGSGIVGSAPKARFVPISGTSFDWRATEEMFKYCTDNNLDIVSCSWGSTDPRFDLNSIKKDAISKAAKEGRNGKGLVICYAAGNEGLDYINFYAAHPDVIAVGACTSQDEHATYSNQGRELDIVAPSNGDWPITAARAWWDEGVGSEFGNFKYWRDGQNRSPQHKHFGGTSSACPLVAGICALVLSANPDLTAKQVKEVLCRTADKIGDPSEYDDQGHSKKFGYGRVNADRAVAEAIRMRDGVETTPTNEMTVEDMIKMGRGIFRFNVQSQKPEGFGVQIGAFAKYGNVLIQVEKLQKKFSLPIIVSINELNGITVYKIVVGAFVEKRDADELKKQMKEAGVAGFVRNFKDLLV